MKNKFIAVSLVIIGVLVQSCGFEHSAEKYRDKFEVASKFYELFPSSCSDIGYHSGMGSPLVFSSYAIVYERYLISINFDLKRTFFGYKKNSNAKLVILEVTNDRIKNVGFLEESKWLKVDDFKDIYKLLNFTPKTNSPVADIKTRVRIRTGY